MAEERDIETALSVSGGELASIALVAASWEHSKCVPYCNSGFWSRQHKERGWEMR